MLPTRRHTRPGRNLDRCVLRVLLLRVALLAFQGCAREEGLFSPEQRAELERRLKEAGVAVAHISPKFRPLPPTSYPGWPPLGEGFVLGVNNPRRESIDDRNSKLEPVVREYLAGKDLKYQYVFVEVMTEGHAFRYV